MNISNEVHEALLPLPAGPSHAEVDEHAADDSAQTGLGTSPWNDILPSLVQFVCFMTLAVLVSGWRCSSNRMI